MLNSYKLIQRASEQVANSTCNYIETTTEEKSQTQYFRASTGGIV